MPSLSQEALLRIDRLAVSFQLERGELNVVRNLSLSIQRGEIVGLLGESGCGKTTTALAILGLLAANAVVKGSVRFHQTELRGAAGRTLDKIRGGGISLVFQEPSLSLNPVLRVVNQVEQVLKAHQSLSVAERRDRARNVLDKVGLHTERLQKSYPHELSGGQRQRVLIAQAIVCDPSLVIADEPTGSLDAVSAREILGLLRDLVHRLNASLLLITHDPRLSATIADRVLIMYAGTIVESGPASEVLRSPSHPYTRGLLCCLRDLGAGVSDSSDKHHLGVIEGTAPDFHSLPPGCSFEPRCGERTAACTQSEPGLVQVGSREVRCILHAQ